MLIKDLPHEQQLKYIDYGKSWWRDVFLPCTRSEFRSVKNVTEFTQIFIEMKVVDLANHSLNFEGDKFEWQEVDKMKILIDYLRK